MHNAKLIAFIGHLRLSPTGPATFRIVSLTIHGHSYEDVYVYEELEITVQEFHASIRRKKNEIHLRLSTQCTYSHERCFTNEGTCTF